MVKTEGGETPTETTVSNSSVTPTTVTTGAPITTTATPAK